jgi:streptomycin 6-kinase
MVCRSSLQRAGFFRCAVVTQLAMLKVAVVCEEKVGARLMQWWGGRGAARVLAYDDDGILLERARVAPSLVQLVHSGYDDEASLIICETVAALHAPRLAAPPPLVPLDHWFDALRPTAKTHGGILQVAASVAAGLLAERRDVSMLHGDIHHGNILNFGPRGWLAIDPKGLIGERAFDYANLFCNPDDNVVTRPDRPTRQLGVVACAAGLDARRLLAWVVAWAALSAAFLLQDGLSPEQPLWMTELAAAEFAK